MSEYPTLVKSEDFAKALEAAGLIGSLIHIEEIVIRMRVGSLVTIETTQVGDDRLYGLVATLGAKPETPEAATDDEPYAKPLPRPIPSELAEAIRTADWQILDDGESQP